MKTYHKKILILILFFIFNLFLVNKIFAISLNLNPSKTSLGRGEQFYIDLTLNTSGENINAISGSILFPADKLTFIRQEEGKSIVDLWVEKPKLNVTKDGIIFAGVVTHGFSGVIDSFDPNNKLPGQIIRLVFEAKTVGQVDFSTSPFYLNKNDGEGTSIIIPSVFSEDINIGDFASNLKYENTEISTLDLNAYIIKNENIFDNKYVLIFKAIDKENGIKSVKIKEGYGDWSEVESPYLLKDQSRHSNINIQAINFSGSGVVKKIDKIPYNFIHIFQIAILFLVLFLIFILIKKNVKK